MLKRLLPLTALGLILFVTERSFGLMEPPAAPRIERLFQRCDANHDGVIDAKEFEEAMKLLAQERARPPRESRPQARPEPQPGPRPSEEAPPPPGARPGSPEGLDPRLVEAVRETLRRMLPQVQERMGQRLQEREGRMRGEFREGFERAMREREERAPQFVRRIVEEMWNEHRREIQRMIDESVQRAMHEGPGRPGMGHPGMQQPGMRHPGMGGPGMDRPPMPPGGEFDREYLPPPPPFPSEPRGDDWRNPWPRRTEAGVGPGAGMRGMRGRAAWGAERDGAPGQFKPKYWSNRRQRGFADGPPPAFNHPRLAKFRQFVAAHFRQWMQQCRPDRGGPGARDGFESRERAFDGRNRDGEKRMDRRDMPRGGPREKRGLEPGE